MGLKDPTRPRSAPKLDRPRKAGAGVSHGARELIAKLSPVHVTLKRAEGLPSPRGARAFRVVHEALRAGRQRPGRLSRGAFRIVHFSVQGDHVHLIVEADGREALTRGVAGTAIRIARGLNRLARRQGKVWADRYHARMLSTPTEVYRALRYLFLNAEKHGLRAPGSAPDPCSSARWFEGWARVVRRPLHASLRGVSGAAGTARAARGMLAEVARPVVEASTWLLRAGWTRAPELRA